MKVLLGHTFYRMSAPSGEDAVFRNEKKLLQENGVDVITFEKMNDDLINSSVIEKIRNGVNCVWSRRAQAELRELLLTTKPDIAHFHNTFPQLSPSVYAACAEVGIPVVQTLHNYRFVCPGGLLLRNGLPCEDCIDGSLLSSLQHRCYRDSLLATSALTANIAINRLNGSFKNNVQRYIALTQFAKDRFIAGGLPAHKISIKPNFLDDVPAPSAKENYAVYVGRLTAEKGVKTLIQGWAHLNGNIPLKIIGDGELRPELENLARTQRLPIEFLGQMPKLDVLRLIAAARIQLIPSECYEGFPMAVLEAFASRTPIVASRIGGLAEILQDNVTGLSFTPGDDRGLANTVMIAWNNSALLSELSANGRRIYEEHYQPATNFRLLMKIYQDAQQEFRNGKNEV